MEVTTPQDDAAVPEEGSRTVVAARNAAVRGVAELLGKVATLVLMVVAARSLGEEGFGVFSFALALALLLASVPAGGFTTVLVQRASADPASLPLLMARCLALTTLIALPVFGLVGGAAAVARPTREGGIAVGLLMVAVLLELWGDVLRAGAQALQRQAGVSAALVVQRLVTTTVVCVLLALGGGVVSLCTGYLVGSALGLVAFAVAAHRAGVRVDRALPSRGELAELARSSFAIGVDSIVSMALFRLDAVLLGLLAGDRAVGHYSAAYRFLETVLFLTWVVNSAVFPSVSADPEPWRVRRSVDTGLAAIATVYVPFGVLLLLRPEDLLRLLYTEAFVTDGALVLRLLAGAPLAFALGYLCSYALLARERRGRVLAASCVAAGVNIAANLALIPVFGASGAAAATTGSYLLEAVVLVVWLRREVGLQAQQVLRPLLVPVLATVPLAAVLLTGLPLLAAVAVGAVAYAVAWLLLAVRLAPEPVALLRGLLPGRAAEESS